MIHGVHFGDFPITPPPQARENPHSHVRFLPIPILQGLAAPRFSQFPWLDPPTGWILQPVGYPQQ